MNQSGLKEPGKINVSKIGERFHGKLENLGNYYAFKNLRFSTVWSEAKYIFFLLNFIPFLLSVREWKQEHQTVVPIPLPLSLNTQQTIFPSEFS